MKTLYVYLLSFVVGLSSAFAGGASGGGGDLDPDKKPTPEEVKKFIDENAQVVVPAMFNWEGTMISSTTDPFNRAFRARLFPTKGMTAVEVAKTTKFSVQVGMICVDPDSKEQKDGAVLEDGSICLDPVRIADKTNITNYKLKSMALFAHEVTHLMGPAPKDAKERLLRESEAKSFETSILMNMDPKIDAYLVKQRADYLKKDINDRIDSLDKFWRAFEQGGYDDQMTCFYVGILGQQIANLGKFEGFHRIWGATPIHYSTNSLIAELLVRAYNLSGYCSTDRIPEFRKDIDSKFEGRDALPVNEFAPKRGWQGITSTRPIRKMDYLNRTDLIQEVIQMKVLLEEVKRLGRL